MKALHFSGLLANLSITKAACLALVLALFPPLGEAQADERRGFDERRGYDRSWSRDHRFNNNASWRRHVNKRRYRHDDRDSISVSLNFGHVTGSNWRPYYRESTPKRYTSSGFSNFFPGSFGRYNSRAPVVIYQNNPIEVSRPVIRSKTYTSTRTGTSLLREISGRCFERTIDKRGIERRTEVPASVCNF